MHATSETAFKIQTQTKSFESPQNTISYTLSNYT
jgi:hypothetical protein